MNGVQSKLKGKDLDFLFEAILKLEDICTISELKALAQRLHVAKMLREKKTYTEIAEETKASTATISRVNRCLNYGADGYNNILNRLEEK